MATKVNFYENYGDKSARERDGHEGIKRAYISSGS